jgi:hypothetical protein
MIRNTFWSQRRSPTCYGFLVEAVWMVKKSLRIKGPLFASRPIPSKTSTGIDCRRRSSDTQEHTTRRMPLHPIRSSVSMISRPWISSFRALAADSSPVLRRPIQTSTTIRKSMPAASMPFRDADISQAKRDVDTAACTAELEIALGKGQIKQEEFLKTVERLHGVASSSSSDDVSTAASDAQAIRFKRMVEVTVSKIFPAGFGMFPHPKPYPHPHALIHVSGTFLAASAFLAQLLTQHLFAPKLSLLWFRCMNADAQLQGLTTATSFCKFFSFELSQTLECYMTLSCSTAGWQLGATMAGNSGFSSTSLGFFAATGQ